MPSSVPWNGLQQVIYNNGSQPSSQFTYKYSYYTQQNAAYNEPKRKKQIPWNHVCSFSLDCATRCNPEAASFIIVEHCTFNLHHWSYCCRYYPPQTLMYRYDVNSKISGALYKKTAFVTNSVSLYFDFVSAFAAILNLSTWNFGRLTQ